MHCFKLMSKMAVMAVMFLVITAVSAFSTPINSYWDLGNTSLGIGEINSGSGLTGIFNQITYKARSSTTQYDTDGSNSLTIGDYYLNSANAYGTGLDSFAGTNVDDRGMGSAYELTLVLTNLLGKVQDIATGTDYDYVTNKYLSGTIHIYIDDAPDRNFKTSMSIVDDTGFTDQICVATISNVTGIGLSEFTKGSIIGSATPEFLTGSYVLSGTFTSLLDNFWYTEDGEDLLEKLVTFQWLIGNTGGDINNVEQVFDGSTSVHSLAESNISGLGTILYTIDGDHDTSFELAAVPEPTTCLLLGCGLLGLSGVSRKKFKK